jgi:alpha-N-acetylglucosaminidase
LKHDALVDVSWYVDDAIHVPAKLPLPTEKIHKSTKLKDRFFLNYCTFGYTTPFWHWRDWERCIDWMALNGINLPLAQNGNEFIWQKVWRSYGLSDDEIRAYFTGPAYLPWHRMVNIDRWDGPLPQSFIDGQRDLQKQILTREREFGMSPVLCAFAGHVPEALKTKHPEFNIQRIPSNWNSFAQDDGCWFLNPLDPKFVEIQTRFLEQQQKEYGTSHFYGTDPFNEISPPSWDASYLANVSQAIYGGMAKVDSEAVWLQMAWTFYHDRKHWNDERLSAMINAVPHNRMVLIDYVCENQEIFRDIQSFYGAPFIWDYLGNFGGNTYLVGPLDKINQRLTAAMNDETLTNLVGLGATLEGLNNPVVYELLYDRAWEGTNLDVSTWVRHEADARAGVVDTNIEQAWNTLHEKVLLDANAIGGHGVIFQSTNPSFSEATKPRLSIKVAYNNSDLFLAWRQFLQVSRTARKNSAYERDLVDVTRQALGNLGLTLRDQMAAAHDKKDVAAFSTAAEKFMTLGQELDKFLGTRREFMLGKWINDAKSLSDNPDEQKYFETDARGLLTIWGGTLNDYAGRQWNGLMRDYYLPRWQLLIDATLTELKGGPAVNSSELQKKWREQDLRFARMTGGNYATEPKGDFYAMSRALFEKYEPFAVKH